MTISALFDTQEEARRAVEELRAAGVPDRDLSVIARDPSWREDTQVTDDDHTNLLRGILGGGALGAGLGVAALAIPGVGPFIAAGTIAATATPAAMAVGGAVGAAAGTMNEALKDHGVSDADADYYSDRIRNGGVFVSVDANGAQDRQLVEEIFYRNGGHNSTRASTI
ncbi:general stress protein [Altericroceibacterium xinjiangense]|uniref:general stress protein n=1 Tax=Altericroceibacterium xinjiangense TaxID=762261 RepID=UPI000F7E1962|nr:general stress protein [Altericroceibacterium xinjiangense]